MGQVVEEHQHQDQWLQFNQHQSDQSDVMEDLTVDDKHEEFQFHTQDQDTLLTDHTEPAQAVLEVVE